MGNTDTDRIQAYCPVIVYNTKNGTFYDHSDVEIYNMGLIPATITANNVEKRAYNEHDTIVMVFLSGRYSDPFYMYLKTYYREIFDDAVREVKNRYLS